jgi:hypothetical protein
MARYSNAYLTLEAMLKKEFPGGEKSPQPHSVTAAPDIWSSRSLKVAGGT